MNHAQTEPMTEAEIRKLPSYLDLTEKQRALVLEFTKNGGDKVAAVIAVYAHKSANGARVASYAYFKNPRVRRCLDEVFRVTKKDQYIREIDEAVRNPKLAMAQVEALAAKGRLLGFLPKNYRLGD